MASVLVVLLLASACQSQTGVSHTASQDQPPQADRPGAAADEPDDAPTIDETDAAPVPYIPTNRPGTAQAYNELVEGLSLAVPRELRPQIPWPDLRHPDPTVAQTEIFELWIWMAETLTEPELVDVMAAPGSPSRDTVVSVFGDLRSQNLFEVRTGAPYKAFDHRVITFESAGLPLWLGRDVPPDAVVVYYRDDSGPVDLVDQDSGVVQRSLAAVPTRSWLSIMVPTDAGWMLWRDQLIEPSDPELEFPDAPPPPGADAATRPQDV